MTPFLRSFLFCDYAILDVATQKFTMVGVFNSFYGESFPLTLPPFFVYYNLGDVNGSRAEVSVTILNPELSVVSQGGMVVAPYNQNAEGVFRFDNVTVDSPGSYICELKLNGELVSVFSFRVADLGARKLES